MSLLRLFFAVALALVLTAFSPSARAQPHPLSAPPVPSASASEPEVAPDSPRAAMKQFVELCNAGEYAEAARFLDLPPSKSADGAVQTQKLRRVLERFVPGLTGLASPFSSGNASDKLPGVDEIGSVPGPNGSREPVRIVRRASGQGPAWVFSRATVERIDVWYPRLENRWILESLPEPLLRTGPFDILYWQYLAMLAFIVVAWAAGRLLAFVTRKIIARAVARTASRWDDDLLVRIGAPLTLAWGLGAFRILVMRLGLYESARDTVVKVISAGFLIALFWSGLRAIDVAKAYALEAAAPGRASARSLVPLGAQTVKILVICAAIVTVLNELGYPVTSLVAGLGIGGIALALAAQKTVEHLFGSLSIGIDQPFRVGDFIRVEDVQGTVESVGLRSTRIRTPDRTLVTIPNGKLADMRIECFTVRDRYRLSMTLPLVYETTAAQLRQILSAIEAVLHEEPTLHKDGTTVTVKGIGAVSVDVEVTAWFDTKDVDAFTKVRHELILRFLEIVENKGSALAHPVPVVPAAAAKEAKSP